MLINCNSLYSLRHIDGQTHMYINALSVKIINKCSDFAMYQFKSTRMVLCQDLLYVCSWAVINNRAVVVTRFPLWVPLTFSPVILILPVFFVLVELLGFLLLLGYYPTGQAALLLLLLSCWKVTIDLINIFLHFHCFL